MRLRERALFAYENIPPGARRLLDVGCYDGLATERFAEKVEEAIGIDPDAPAVARGNQRQGRARFIAGHATALPFPDGYFDVVTFIEVLEHLPRGTEVGAISEIARVLQPGGTLLLSTPHAGLFAWLDPLDARSRFRRLRRRFRQRAWQVWLEEKGHYHFTMKELLTLLSPYFQIVSIRRTSLILHPLSTAMERLPQSDRLLRLREHMSDWDWNHGFGAASYNARIVAHRR